jgi:NADH-quinone oxidoreductase subunit G
LKPRLNPEVNGYWMCDIGRLGYGFVDDPKRLKRFERRASGTSSFEPISFQTAIADVAKRLGEPGAFAVASAWMTNEELFLLSRLFEKGHVFFMGRSKWEEQRFFPSFGDALRNPSLPGQKDRGKRYPDGATFVIEADRNPNRRGAELVLGREATTEDELRSFCDACERGEVKSALVFSGMPDFAPPEALLRALEKVPFVAVCDILPGPLAERAHVLLPGATFAEKEGTFTNGRGATQRFIFAKPPPGQARCELETLHALGQKLEKGLPGAYSAERTFEALVAAAPELKDLTWRGLAPKGPTWSPHYLGNAPAEAGWPPAHAREPAAKAGG